ncbi:MAG: Trm112 family protein [Candidatus Omnitrophica bacterium]|nr:Trm112 family protein [Candidatus Omnitrophota bacterium]
MMIDSELLSILACPACKGDVKLEDGKIVCVNPQCGLRYPVRDGIPVMLIEEAEKPEEK